MVNHCGTVLNDLSAHLCRGNNRSHWYAEGGYDAIAEKLFGTLEVDRFLLEYDDERSGTFEPLRFVPKDKTVVLGLSSKVPRMEDSELLAKNESTKPPGTSRSTISHVVHNAASLRPPKQSHE
jgi:methionine synthase II (cobalamin-independent)